MGVEHHIVTRGPPITARFCRLDAEKLAAAKAEFLQLEKEGIVRRSDSPWASPLHMVRKPDGSWRPCGDYRRLNMVTEPDAYYLPNMMDFNAWVDGCTVFSKIDLRKGYLQIPMHQADVQKTAIITPFGLFEFLRLPFSLRNAGNTFQQKMDRVTGDLDNAFTYLDSLMVFSRSLEDHEAHLLQVFSRLQEHGLVINLEKCVFGVTSADFLGHKMSSLGVCPLPAYVDTVDKFPKPTCIKELQASLGLVNFYRKFLPAIAHTLCHLTDTLKGSKKGTEVVQWSEVRENALVSAKQALAKATLLAHPAADATLALVVDASNSHIGACFQQR
jgi:cleavage and polyadenylation specificity factor subunit 1